MQLRCHCGITLYGKRSQDPNGIIRTTFRCDAPKCSKSVMFEALPA